MGMSTQWVYLQHSAPILVRSIFYTPTSDRGQLDEAYTCWQRWKVCCALCCGHLPVVNLTCIAAAIKTNNQVQSLRLCECLAGDKPEFNTMCAHHDLLWKRMCIQGCDLCKTIAFACCRLDKFGAQTALPMTVAITVLGRQAYLCVSLVDLRAARCCIARNRFTKK